MDEMGYNTAVELYFGGFGYVVGHLPVNLLIPASLDSKIICSEEQQKYFRKMSGIRPMTSNVN